MPIERELQSRHVRELRLAGLGWRARTDLAEGLAQMYRWYSNGKVDVAA